MKKLFFLLLIIFSFQKNSFSQDQHLVDSLETQLKDHNAHKQELQINNLSSYDTTAAKILDNLSWAYVNSDPVKSMDYAKQCLAMSEQIGFKKGIANSYNNMGILISYKGDLLSGLEFHKKALKIREEIGNTKGIAGSYNNIGQLYAAQGKYDDALKNYFAALKINEQLVNKSWQGMNLSNIGDVYYSQHNIPEALKYALTALKIKEEIGDKQGISNSYMQIGRISMDQQNYAEALKNMFAALKIQEETGNKMDMAYTYNFIGEVYTKQGNFSEAEKYHLDALKIHEEMGNIEGVGYSYHDLGRTNTEAKRYGKAADYLNKAMSIIKKIGELEGIQEIEKDLSTLYRSSGDYKQALEHYKLYIDIRDSLINNENTKKITQQQMQYEFDKKESLTKAENEKELQKQKMVRNGFVGGFAVVLLFAGVFFSQRNKTRKQKKLAEVEKKRSEDLLLNILPGEVAEEIKTTGTAKAKSFTMITVMFTDFKDFTSVSEKISAELLVDEIHTCFSAFDGILQKHKIEKIKTIGDAYLCASGLPVSNYTHAVDMLNAAFEIRSYMLQRKKEKESRGEIPFDLRIGIHTGPVVAGVVGVKKYAYDIWGDTVNIAARMEQNSEAGKVNISGTTYELVKDNPMAIGFNFIHRGKIPAKNKGEIDMYFADAIL